MADLHVVHVVHSLSLTSYTCKYPGIFKQVLGGQRNIKAGPCKNLSREAKQLLLCLLTRDVKVRLKTGLITMLYVTNKYQNFLRGQLFGDRNVTLFVARVQCRLGTVLQEHWLTLGLLKMVQLQMHLWMFSLYRIYGSSLGTTE